MKSRRLERQFGWLVGGVFLALGLWALWRGRWPVTLAAALAASGLTLIGLAFVYPAVLVRPRRYWMALAEALSFVSTRVILGVVFLLIMLPIGLVMRRFGWDPLAARSRGGASHWRDYPAQQHNPKHFEQMF